MRSPLLLVLTFAAVTHADPPIESVRFHPDAASIKLVGEPQGESLAPAGTYKDALHRERGTGWFFRKAFLWGDRLEYWADDECAQFFGVLAAPKEGVAGHNVGIEIVNDAGTSVAQHIEAAQDHRVSFLLATKTLPVGKYTAHARLVDAEGKTVSRAAFSFTRSDKRGESVAFPDDGVSIVVEEQPHMADGVWPVRVGVPLPLGTVTDARRLALFEDGVRVAAEVRPVAMGSPAPGASVQWIHLDFLAKYTGGKPAAYRLRLTPEPQPATTSTLKVSETADRISIDTGAISFSIDREAFAGIEDVLSNGRTLVDRADDAGPYLVDQKGVRYEARLDRSAAVAIEEHGPVKATVVARGWYANPNADDKRLCLFTTRITAYAGQPMVRVSHQTYITYDTHTRQLRDLGFSIPITKLPDYAIGADDAAHRGALPASGSVFIHQDRPDRFRIVAGDIETVGKRSDGWACAYDPSRDNQGVGVILRDIWQKYPKEIELSRSALTLHLWPKHGRRANTLEEELDLANIYKFLCFHHGELMDLKTPEAYCKRFEEYAATPESHKEGSHLWYRPSERDATRDGNAQGVVISNDFTLVLGDISKPSHKLVQLDPAAAAPPTWNCATGALGPIAPAGQGDFAGLEEAIHEGWLSWTRSVERYNDYGMFNYADTQTIDLVGECRAGLHRVWQGSHYHNIGTNWQLYYRTGSPAMLRWARANSDHYMNVDTTNYVNRENPIPFMDHELGAMQHLGWKMHWASSRHGGEWGQFRGTAGHFIDPDAHLWCWYITGNPRAKEAYDLWAQSYRAEFPMLLGHAREVNTTLAYYLSAYRATYDPVLIPAIHTMAWSLRTAAPLETQQPGPLWHSWWINRYYEQTRDPEYVPFILQYGNHDIATIALAAKAFDVSGDRRYLDRFLPQLRNHPRRLYRRAEDPWDWYGAGPGPLGDGYVAMDWGLFLDALHRAGIAAFPDNQPHGWYPCTPERYDHPNLPFSVQVLALEPEDRAFETRLSLNISHAVSGLMFSPGGKQLFAIDRILEGDANKPRAIAADGETGLNRIEYRAHTTLVPFPQTDLEHEAAVIRPGLPYWWNDTRLYVQPTDASKPVEVAVESEDARRPSHVVIEDATGKQVFAAHVFAPRPEPRVTATLDPAEHPLPWCIDVVNVVRITIGSDKDAVILCAANPAALDVIAGAVRQKQ